MYRQKLKKSIDSVAKAMAMQKYNVDYAASQIGIDRKRRMDMHMQKMHGRDPHPVSSAAVKNQERMTA
jgi:hypothetical protein